MRSDPAGWRLYLIPRQEADPARLGAAARAGLAGGADVVQLRLKGASDGEWLASGAALREACREFGRPMIVNDRPDLSAPLGADGVHVGQGDVPVREARRIVGGERVVGVSVATPEEARRAEEEGADYVAVGPVFASLVKPSERPLGLEAVRRVRQAVRLPLVAIGGIDVGNAAAVVDAGADGVAVISAVADAADPEAAARELRGAVGRARAVRGRG